MALLSKAAENSAVGLHTFMHKKPLQTNVNGSMVILVKQFSISVRALNDGCAVKPHGPVSALESNSRLYPLPAISSYTQQKPGVG